MTVERPTALIADDEPLLRDALERLLVRAWPELDVVARARNGREAIELFDAHAPKVCFLDVQMPGKTGVEAAHADRRASALWPYFVAMSAKAVEVRASTARCSFKDFSTTSSIVISPNRFRG
jgi:CheY-like chemotaxis protein